MATKAERFKLRAERAAQATRPKRSGKKAALRAKRTQKRLRTALVERRGGAAGSLPHNTALRPTDASVYELEAVSSGRPSRKSTRKSPSHLKTDTTLRRRARERTVSPEARSGRRARKRRVVRRIVKEEEE